jgi:hypothetical protein
MMLLAFLFLRSMMQRHLRLTEAAMAAAEPRDAQAARCPTIRSQIHEGCEITSRGNCNTVVCISHIVANSSEIRHGAPDLELNPLDGTVSKRVRRQLPSQIAGGGTSIAGMSFSYSISITSCQPLGVRIVLNGFGRILYDQSVTGNFVFNIPGLNLQAILSPIPILNLLSGVLGAAGLNGHVSLMVTLYHNGVSLVLNMDLGLCYSMTSWWPADLIRRAYNAMRWLWGGSNIAQEGCCCRLHV